MKKMTYGTTQGLSGASMNKGMGLSLWFRLRLWIVIRVYNLVTRIEGKQGRNV